MFKKLLSNLPYNPSLIGQVSFYAKRLRGEEKLRRIGLVFVALSFVVQMFAFISAPEPTLAESDNDIIRGGFQTREQAVLHCLNGSIDFYKILTYYGVGCDDVAKASTITIRSTAADYDSLGRTQQGATVYRPVTGKTNQTDEYSVNIPGVQTLWMKNLRAWDSYSHSDYKVLKMTRSDGKVIMIMYNCGNIVTVGKYTPPAAPAPTPMPTPSPTPTPQQTPGNAVCKSLTATALSERKYRFKTVTSGTDYQVKSYTYDFGDGNTKVVNSSLKSSTTEHTYSATKRYDASVKIAVEVQGATSMVKRTLDCSVGVTTNTPDACPYVEGTQSTTSECDVCPSISGTQSQPEECKPCQESQSDDDALACLVTQKTATNDTQKITDANNTMANAGDKITYTFSVKNNGKTTIKNFIVEDNISDILDYATTTDLNGAKVEGTTVRWPATTLSPGESVRKKLTVKIKNPIPRTPVSISDPTHFDLVMNNVFYDDQITIKLPPDVIKTTEIVTSSLPKTGPGETMVAVVGFTVFVSYFFARTRLFAKEMDIVRHDYATTGGY